MGVMHAPAITQTAPSIEQIVDTFGLSYSELADILHVKRQALAEWRHRGVPPARSADVDRLLELAERFGRSFKRNRIPQIVRTPGRGLSDRTVLQVLRTDGPQPVSDYLYRLMSFTATP
jgi:transcriptional regulator with XRE-family HTH domain